MEFDGVRSRRQVTFGMFAWAVRCGIISDDDLVENAKQVGSFLHQLVKLCHGTGFVDIDVEAFLRCVVCAEHSCLLNVFSVL